MKYLKLNKNWNAEPNAPAPEISKTEEGIQLTFLLNSNLYQHIDENDRGTLAFSEVYAYRLGATNEEGYSRGQFRFKNEKLPWGAFYELSNSNWQKDFPDDQVLLDASIKKNQLRHFIFFLKDQTFECLAVDCKFSFQDTVSDELETKYPKGYLNHYLAMFTKLFDKSSLENYRMFTDLYIQMNGKNEFLNLKNELQTIKANKDLASYVKFANYFEMENFGIEELNEMIKVIEKYKVVGK